MAKIIKVTKQTLVRMRTNQKSPTLLVGMQNGIVAMRSKFILDHKGKHAITIQLSNRIGEGNGTHSSTLAWKIPWTEEPGRLQSMGSQRVVHDCTTSLPLFTFMHWRRKWQPTPCSCLENPRDGGAWWPAVYEVAQSRTGLKRLSSSNLIPQQRNEIIFLYKDLYMNGNSSFLS